MHSTQGNCSARIRVERGGPVKLLFFGGLSFGRIATPDTLTTQRFQIASLPDLVAAKLKGLWQRAEAKDYLDVAAILRAGLSLSNTDWAAPAHYSESKKTLRKILRFLCAGTLSPDKAINGSPINAAEFSERVLGRRRLALCLQNHAPVRGSKRRRAAISGSANRTLGSHLIISRGHGPIELENLRARQAFRRRLASVFLS